MEREAAIKLMRSSKSRQQWDVNCDKVRASTKDLPEEERRGYYPAYWYPVIIASGLMAEVQASWN